MIAELVIGIPVVVLLGCNFLFWAFSPNAGWRDYARVNGLWIVVLAAGSVVPAMIYLTDSVITASFTTFAIWVAMIGPGARWIRNTN